MSRQFFLRLFVCLLFCGLLTACAGRGPSHPGHLPRVDTQSGDRVHLDIHADNPVLEQEVHDMLASYLAGESGLVITDNAAAAQVLLRVDLDKVRPSGATTSVNPRYAGLGMAAGGLTGSLVGMAADPHSYRGSAIGSAAGALAGLGLALMAGSEESVLGWQLSARVGVGHDGRRPEPGKGHELTVYAEGEGMTEETCLPMLEDQLCLQIADALDPLRP